MRERQHYYYTIFHNGRWEIVKSFNLAEMRRHGYQTDNVKMRFGHYKDAYLHVRTVHHCRPYYVSLTGNDFID